MSLIQAKHQDIDCGQLRLERLNLNERLKSLLLFTPEAVKATAGVSFILNVVFFALLVVGCCNHFLPKKRYTLLANRSLIDALMSLLTFSFLWAKHKVCDIDNDNPNLCIDGTWMKYPVPVYLLQVGLTLNYWMLSVSYSAIALLTWYAVKYPLDYRIKLTVGRVIKSIIVVWSISVLFLMAFSKLSGMEIFKRNAMIIFLGARTDRHNKAVLAICNETAQYAAGRFDHIVALGLPIFGFVCTIGSYALVCVLLVQKRKVNRLATRQFAGIWRLGIHIVCMVFSCTLMAVAHFASSQADESCRLILLGLGNHCEKYDAINVIFSFVLISSIATIGWFLRMIVDPLLDVIMDGRIRTAIRQRMHNPHGATSSSLLMLSEMRLSNTNMPHPGRTVLGRLPGTNRTDSLYSMISRC